MKNRLIRLQILAAGAVAIALYGCGGGSSGGSGGGAPVGAVSTITGTAATGGALVNAPVAISNTAGNSPCTEASVTTSERGSYTCTLKDGEVAPFFIKVTDPTGDTPPLVSIATTTPAAGTPLRVNATPLTTAIVAQLNGGDALGVLSNKGLYSLESFNAVKANVIAQIQPAVTALDPALANYDPFTTSITAATAGSSGNTADQVLDVIKITKTASGALALSTIADPTPVAIATATEAGTPMAAPQTATANAMADLTKAAALIGQAFQSCYALPPAQRVTLDANFSITEILGDCKKITDTGGTQTGLPAYKHNGYSEAASFYKMLNASAMTGAAFSAPEVMAFYPADSTHPRDRAILNIRFVDKQGYPGNRITMAQNLPNSSTTARPTNWWLTGNQWNYDLGISTQIWRNRNFYPTPHGNFQNGLAIFINGANTGPNSSLYDSALVTGDGLPTNGLWFVRSANSGQFTMTTVRSTAPQTTATLNQALVCGSCSSFWMSKTTGLVNAAATTLATNPTQPPYNAQWGSASDGSYNGVTGTRPTKGSVYVFKLYNNGALVATESRILLTDLVPATQEVNLPWNTVGTATTNALDVTNTALNGTQTALPLDWAQNPLAEQIQSIWVSQTDGGYDNATPILPGATSVIATPRTGDGTTTTFTSMVAAFSDSLAPFGGYREIGFKYRMLDGSSKTAVYFYSP